MYGRDGLLALGIGLLGLLAAPALAANDVETLVAARLTGIAKPGTTQAGPATLELANTLGASIAINLYLPPLAEFRGSHPVVAIARVLNETGADVYDPGHPLEAEFFQRVQILPSSVPVPSLQGMRSVKLKIVAGASALRQIDGTVRLSLPIKPLTASFAIADIGKEQKVHRRVITLLSFNAKEADVRFQGDSPLVTLTGYGADGKPVQTGMRPGSPGIPKITFQAPAVKLELVFAERMVERQFPFTLTPASVAGNPAK